MPPRVVIYKGTYQYGAVNLFADEIAEGFRKLGRETVFVDLTDTSALQSNLSKAFSGSNVEFILSFNAAGYCFELNAKSLYDSLPFPFFAFLVDHPAHHLDRLRFNNIIISAMDRSHVHFLNNYFKGSKKVFFMPHGGCRSSLAGTPREKKIDVLFPASYMDMDEELTKIKSLEPFSQKLIYDSVDIILKNDAIPIEDALEAIGRGLGINIYEGKIFYKMASEIINKIETLVRAIKRTEMLKILDDAGIAVDIYGNGWPENRFKSHRVHKALPFNEINDLMTESRIVINAANIADGAHERVFTTMLNGSLCLSDYNPCLAETFREDSEIVFYRWTKITGMPDIITKLLADNELLENISLNGAAVASASHKWEHRAAQLIKIVEESK